MDWPEKSPIKFGITPQCVRLEAVPFEDINIEWSEVSSMYIYPEGVKGVLPHLDNVTKLKKLALVLDGWKPKGDVAIVVNNVIEEWQVRCRDRIHYDGFAIFHINNASRISRT